MTIRLRNRKGEDITWDEYRALMEGDGEDMTYYRVKQTDVGSYWVSTIWCGMAQKHDELFETAIFFGGHDGDLLTTERRATEEGALAAHDADVRGIQELVDRNIDFAGIVAYVRGERDELPNMEVMQFEVPNRVQEPGPEGGS